MNRPRQVRLVKLIKPRLQMRMVLGFLALLLLALVFQCMLVQSEFSALAQRMPQSGGFLLEQTNHALLRILALSLLVLLPLCLMVGILVTFRIAGPVFRLERHLHSFLAGEDPGPCRLRKGDHLHDLCELVNRATVKDEALASEDEQQAA